MAKSLERRIEALSIEVERLQAQEAIRGRVHECARALDRLDRDLLIEQFWPDAAVDYGVFFKGPVAEFFDVAMKFQGAMRDTQHLVGNVHAHLEGSHAVAESYVHACHVIAQGDDLVQLLVGARYLDRFDRRDRVWKIAFRTEVMDWGRWLPVAERWFEQNEQMPKGRRDRDDLSYRFRLPG